MFRPGNRKYGSNLIPTQQELVELNFWSIVSDCRAIIAGNLVPRPWADLADTWIEEPRETKLYRMRKARNSGKLRSNVVPREKPIRITMQPTVEIRRVKKDYGLPVPRHFVKMVHILVANGMNMWDARMKARELLGRKR